MRLRGQSDDQLDVRLSIDELLLLKNILHEICNGMHFTEADFQAIFGTSRGEVDALLRHATAVLERLQINSE